MRHFHLDVVLGNSRRLLPHRCHGPNLVHQPSEILERKRLRAVTLGQVRIGVYLNQQTVGAGGYRGHRYGGHQVPPAGAVAGVGDDGQVAKPLDHGNGGHIQREPGVLFESPYPALA